MRFGSINFTSVSMIFVLHVESVSTIFFIYFE